MLRSCGAAVELIIRGHASGRAVFNGLPASFAKADPVGHDARAFTAALLVMLQRQDNGDDATWERFGGLIVSFQARGIDITALWVLDGIELLEAKDGKFTVEIRGNTLPEASAKDHEQSTLDLLQRSVNRRLADRADDVRAG